jgi:L-cysteine/cystine lyase
MIVERVAELRKEIPALSRGVFMNAAWSGPCSRRVLAAMHDYLDAEAADGPTSPPGLARRAEVDRRAREAWAKLLNADLREIALAGNTSEGLNTVFNGISWRRGDRVVTTSMEHASVLMPAYFARSRHGVEVTVVPLEPDDDPQTVVDGLDAAMSPGTRLVAVSHVGYTTGYRLPLEAIIRLAHERGAMVVADGAQALGQLRVDVHELDIDFYAAPGQKWLCGPDGSGVLFVRADRIAELQPSRFAYWAASSYDLHGNFEPYNADARRFELSTTNGGVWAGLAQAIEQAAEIGLDTLEERSTALASYAVRRLLEVPGVRLVSPREGPALSGLVCFRVGDLDPDLVTATLWEREGITLGGRQSNTTSHYVESTRLSAANFNIEADVDRVVEALREVARLGPVEDLHHTKWWRATHGGW